LLPEHKSEKTPTQNQQELLPAYEKTEQSKKIETEQISPTTEQKLLPERKIEQIENKVTELNQKKMDLEREIVDRTAELNQKKKSALGDPEKR
jgi:hypothetical protein